MYLRQIEAAVHVVMLRNSVGGDKLSPEMIMFLVLTLHDGYLLFPSAEERAAFDFVDIAFELGPSWKPKEE
jgi:hypothetical protein